MLFETIIFVKFIDTLVIMASCLFSYIHTCEIALIVRKDMVFKWLPFLILSSNI